MAVELSAPAVALLLDPRCPRVDLARIALRELVLRRAWHVQGTRLVPGAPPGQLPAPLTVVDRALRAVVPAAGLDVRTAVRDAVRRSPSFPRLVASETELALRRSGLAERRWGRRFGVVPWEVLGRTEEGERLARAVRGRLAADGVIVLGALAVLLEPGELARRRAADGGGSGGGAGGEGTASEDTSDLGDFEVGGGDFTALDDIGGGDFDSAFDAGASDGGGGGGDGGGGRDGGGG